MTRLRFADFYRCVAFTGIPCCAQHDKVVTAETWASVCPGTVRVPALVPWLQSKMTGNPITSVQHRSAGVSVCVWHSRRAEGLNAVSVMRVLFLWTDGLVRPAVARTHARTHTHTKACPPARTHAHACTHRTHARTHITHTHKHTHTCTRTHTKTHPTKHTRAHTHKNTPHKTHTHARTHARTHTRTHARTHTHTHARARASSAGGHFCYYTYSLLKRQDGEIDFLRSVRCCLGKTSWAD